jgi:GDP-fucose protein O-fucosyltransferase
VIQSPGCSWSDVVHDSPASFALVGHLQGRKPQFWDKKLQENALIHFRASEKQYRLLSHYYGMLYFTDPAIDHYYKRFVRDFLHYHDSIYCAAGKIVKALQAEGEKRGFKVDEEGGGGYSAMHIRRGDLQYKKVKIPGEEWYANTKEVWKPGEILYIATDERKKDFFDPIKQHHDLRFLDDYTELAGLKDLDPNYMGMIDTIVASRGRAFAGTWFSTFSGYINRLRGYHGMTMMDSWYSFLDRKEALHKWEEVDHFAYAFEWPDCWVGIDADVWPERDKF